MKLMAALVIGLLALAGCASIGPAHGGARPLRLRRIHLRFLEAADAAEPRQGSLRGCAGFPRCHLGHQFVRIQGRVRRLRPGGARRSRGRFVFGRRREWVVRRPAHDHLRAALERQVCQGVDVAFPDHRPRACCSSPAIRRMPFCESARIRSTGSAIAMAGAANVPGIRRYQELLALLREAQNRGDIALYSEKVQRPEHGEARPAADFGRDRRGAQSPHRRPARARRHRPGNSTWSMARARRATRRSRFRAAR